MNGVVIGICLIAALFIGVAAGYAIAGWQAAAISMSGLTALTELVQGYQYHLGLELRCVQMLNSTQVKSLVGDGA